tara:strand:- start:1574 stop:1759 length:186 start_codon:yes stop_codon:yes gene_type:complete
MVVWKGEMSKDNHTIFFDVKEDTVDITETFNDDVMQPVEVSIKDAISRQETLERLGYEFTR